MKPDEKHNLPYTLSRWFCSVFITCCIVHEVAMIQNAQKCCWHCNMKPDWFTSHQSHYCKISGLLLLPFFLGKSSLQELAIFGYYPATLIWRPGEITSVFQNAYISAVLQPIYINFYIAKWRKFRRVVINLVDRTMQWCFKPQLGMNYMSAHHVVVLHKLNEHCA